jgi:hypothetical protein
MRLELLLTSLAFTDISLSEIMHEDGQFGRIDKVRCIAADACAKVRK